MEKEQHSTCEATFHIFFTGNLAVLYITTAFDSLSSVTRTVGMFDLSNWNVFFGSISDGFCLYSIHHYQHPVRHRHCVNHVLPVQTSLLLLDIALQYRMASQVTIKWTILNLMRAIVENGSLHSNRSGTRHVAGCHEADFA
jgi:hypothetical protein